jgi:hypothetical protein
MKFIPRQHSKVDNFSTQLACFLIFVQKFKLLAEDLLVRM